jgi:hypothetical protein
MVICESFEKELMTNATLGRVLKCDELESNSGSERNFVDADGFLIKFYGKCEKSNTISLCFANVQYLEICQFLILCNDISIIYFTCSNINIAV